MREQLENRTGTSTPYFEVLTSEQFAERLSLPVTWVRDQVRRRAKDPIPCLRLGKYVRFQWGSPELEAWIERRKSGNRKLSCS